MSLDSRITDLSLELVICDILIHRNLTYWSNQAILSKHTKQRLRRLRDHYDELMKSGEDLPNADYQYSDRFDN